MHESLPSKTIRDLGAIVIYVAELAWQWTKTVVAKVAPFVRPPDDMVVSCRDGSQYTGILLIEDNDVEAGAVVHSGQGVPEYRPPERPWSKPTPDKDEPGTAIKHWALDEPDEDEPPWRR